MGPIEGKNLIEVSRFDRLNYTAKKATEEYFSRPFYYLFFSIIPLTLVAVIFGSNLSWDYYLVLAGIGAGYFWIEFPKKEKSNKKEKPKKNDRK